MTRIRIRLRWRARPLPALTLPAPEGPPSDARPAGGAPRRRGPDPEIERRRRFRRRMMLGALATVFALGSAQALFGDRGFLDLVRSRSERDRLQGQVHQQLQRVLELKREVRSLREDPHAIERVAREKLGYAKPGEIQLLLPRTDEEGDPGSGEGTP